MKDGISSLSLGLLSFSVLGLNVLVILVLDLVEFLHVLPEILGSLQGDQQLGSLHQSWLILFVLLSVLISSLLVASGLLNLDGLSDEADVVSIAIPDKLFCGDDADRSCVSEGMEN